MSLKWPDKDPDDVLDYDLDWSARLDDGDLITASVFTVAAGDVSIDSHSLTAAATKVWLSGGSINSQCMITNHITTAAGREMDQTVRLAVRSR